MSSPSQPRGSQELPREHASLRVPARRASRASTTGRRAASPHGARMNLEDSAVAPEEDDGGDGSTEISRQGAVAGPSSPSRRRRRPDARRRRSSSISAAASLLSSYSASVPSDDEDDTDDAAQGQQTASRRPQQAKRPRTRQRTSSGASNTFAPDAATIVDDAKRSFFNRKASPYHMALVTVAFSLASDMPLASQFKVYSFMMCKVLQMREGVPDGDFFRSTMGKALSSVGLSAEQPSIEMLPPAPELPSNPICADQWVDDATSTYAASMATAGALLGLILLNRCSKLSQRFGRKPLLLVTHVLLVLSTLAFRFGVLLPTVLGVTTIYIAVVVLEASAGAPLRIAIQNYVVDTTTESQRAAALSFTDGFGQVGAFPSGAMGGWLSAVTQNFFAPFYASIASYVVALFYILVFVPESKKHHRHTIIDDFEEWHHGSPEREARPAMTRGGKPGSRINSWAGSTAADPSEAGYTETVSESYFSLWPRDRQTFKAWLKSWIYRLNFLAPLAVFLPRRRINRFAPDTKQALDWRVFNLAVIVLLEESFQVFLLPMLLLYNTKVFGYDVVQNGYLVSLLQGTRALYLTVIFPAALGRVRSLFKRVRQWQSSRIARLERLLMPSVLRSQQSQQDARESDERTPLMQNANDRSYDSYGHASDSTIEAQAEQNKSAKREERGRLDIIVMLVSYLFSGCSLALLATTRAWTEDYEKHHSSDQGRNVLGRIIAMSPTSDIPPYIGIAVGIVGVQLGAGATSLRTALLVNAVSEQEDEREEADALRDAQWRAHLNGQANGEARDQGVVRQDQQQRHGTADIRVHVHHERHQTRALAANQILCTAVYAFVPLITSLIFGTGLRHGHPELVWVFKSAIAFVCAGATLVLLMSYGLAAQHQSRVRSSAISQR